MTYFNIQLYNATVQGQPLVVTGQPSGQSPTLEALGFGWSPSQQWNAVFQLSAGYGGIAFVNALTGLSIQYQGSNRPLVMGGFGFNNDVNGDAWIIEPGVYNEPVPPYRILVPGTGDNRDPVDEPQQQTWNDYSGQMQVGNVIGVYYDANPNSLWAFINIGE